MASGVAGRAFVEKQERAYVVGLARQKVPDGVDEQVKKFLGNKFVKAVVHQEEKKFVGGKHMKAMGLGLDRGVKAPCMLTVYCNVAEFLRIRQELIHAATETHALTKLYK